MKITRIKWPGNHPILKGLELNLKKNDGTIYDNLIIAAENGYGKTTILIYTKKYGYKGLVEISSDRSFVFKCYMMMLFYFPYIGFYIKNR